VSSKERYTVFLALTVQEKQQPSVCSLMIGPTSGECYLNGVNVHDCSSDLWNNVGYVVEVPYSYPELTVRENLDIVR
jgi:ABC-type multidrug transport system ATPase subunit